MSQIHRLSGLVALVTGGGSGIGRAAALAYAAEGAKVAVAGRRLNELEATVAQIAAAGGEAIAVVADISQSADVAAMVKATVDRFGRLDAAFNNAGISGPFTPLVEMDEADFDKVIATNLKGTWLSIKYEVEAMIAGGHGGSIVNTSSFVSRAPAIGTTAYAASKGALEALTLAVAIEAGPHNIRINTLLPGAIDTDMFRSLDGAAVIKPLSAHTPLKRMGRPQDIGDVAVWLATAEASFITGQSLLIDGGIAIPGMR